jgi:hypothetical protein
LSENGVDDMELRLGPLGSSMTPIIGWFSYVFLIFTARLYSFKKQEEAPTNSAKIR